MKIAKAATIPAKLLTLKFWKSALAQAKLLIISAFRYRTIARNLNSRKFWDISFNKMGDSWRDEHYRYIQDMFPADREFSLIDIGCALGDGCELLKQTYPKAAITGIDFSEVAIEKAKKRNDGVNYLRLDILKEPLPGTYDYITILETLEHFDDPFAVVDICLKHVREAIIVSVPLDKADRKLIGIDWHRYQFCETSFDRYNSRVARITEPIASSADSQCIIFEIKP